MSLLQRLQQWFQPKRPPDNPLAALQQVLDTAVSSHTLDKETGTIIESALAFSKLAAGDVMVPRAHMVFFEQTIPTDTLIERVIASGHSRYPVVSNDHDDVIGVLLAKDLLPYTHKPYPGFLLSRCLRTALFIPESKKLPQLLREFQYHKTHMAIVIDEYGRFSGLITIEDVLERIVGDIDDEHDTDPDTLITPQGPHLFQAHAHTPLQVLNTKLGTHFDHPQFDTLGGLLLHHFERLPQRGETLTLDQITFKIVQADARRIQLVAIERAPDPTAP